MENHIFEGLLLLLMLLYVVMCPEKYGDSLQFIHYIIAKGGSILLRTTISKFHRGKGLSGVANFTKKQDFISAITFHRDNISYHISQGYNNHMMRHYYGGC